MEDPNFYITCDLCNETFAPNEYHVCQHLIYNNFQIPITFFEDNEDENETEIDNERYRRESLYEPPDEYQNFGIRENRQIPTNVSLRTFLRDHLTALPSGNRNRFMLEITTRGNIPTDFWAPVEIGLSSDQIEKVSSNCTKIENPRDICPICQETFDNIQGSVRKLKCEHLYCESCIIRWLAKHKKCPVCNIDLEDTFLKSI